MASLTREEGIQLDGERVRFVGQVMFRYGFEQYKSNESHRGPYKFTDLILYLNDESRDSVAVFFPHEDQVDRGLEIATQAKFKNKIKSPEWQSLYQFEEEIGLWIEECRRQTQGQ